MYSLYSAAIVAVIASSGNDLIRIHILCAFPIYLHLKSMPSEESEIRLVNGCPERMSA